MLLFEFYTEGTAAQLHNEVVLWIRNHSRKCSPSRPCGDRFRRGEGDGCLDGIDRHGAHGWLGALVKSEGGWVIVARDGE